MTDAHTPDLRGRVILITGAGDGLGAALATAAGAAGAEVVLLGRTVAKLECVYDAIVDAGGPQPAIVPMDLEGATPDDYTELANNIHSQWGRLDALVHNAAELGPQTPLAHHPPLDWYRALQVNLTAPLLLTQACLGLLQQASHPTIVFIDDERRSAYWGAYGVSKAAAGALADMLADELSGERGIRIHRHRPPPLRTGLRGRALPGAVPAESTPPAEATADVLALLASSTNG